ncbi:MAG: MBL fold metallo-hydrolase [Deltaproteobacteria bacterium]|nr:MBL fold metallo-hydrolase [Deltaproteobacteria bacterium]
MNDPRDLLKNARWLGHASIVVRGTQTVYVDPWEVSASDPADVILITHDHYDHLSLPDIERLARPDTAIVGPAMCKEALGARLTVIEPGAGLTVHGVELEAVRAYNPKKPFHPKEYGGLGFVFTVDDVRYYHSGDTDRIHEMGTVRADVAFLPVGGKYTMDAAEAAEVPTLVRARVAVPLHYAKIVGELADAERFAKLCKVPVVILERS